MGELFAELGRTVCRRLEAIECGQYRRMLAAVDAALVPHQAQPIVLDVLEKDGGGWYLAFWPASRVIGMRFLQLLATLEEAERTALLLAANHPDLLAEPQPATLEKYCGTTNIGRFERTYDIDDLDPFLYHQRCRLAPGWEQL